MAQNIDGKLIAQKIHEETAAETNRIKEKYGLLDEYNLF